MHICSVLNTSCPRWPPAPFHPSSCTRTRMHTKKYLPAPWVGVVVLVLLWCGTYRVPQEAQRHRIEQQDRDVCCFCEGHVVPRVSHHHDVEGMPHTCAGRKDHTRRKHRRHMQEVSTPTCCMFLPMKLPTGLMQDSLCGLCWSSAALQNTASSMLDVRLSAWGCAEAMQHNMKLQLQRAALHGLCWGLNVHLRCGRAALQDTAGH